MAPGFRIVPKQRGWCGRVDTDNAGGSETEWRAARAEALAVLGDALLWNLTASRWEHVRDAVADLAQAVAATSVGALWQAIGHLELCSPVRVATRLGDAVALPAPMAARERIAELIDALTRDGDLKIGDKPGLDPAPRS